MKLHNCTPPLRLHYSYYVLAVCEALRVVLLAEYDEDKLKAALSEEKKHVEKIEKELQKAEQKAKEIHDRQAKERCIRILLKEFAQVKRKQEDTEVHLQAVKQFVTENGKTILSVNCMNNDIILLNGWT